MIIIACAPLAPGIAAVLKRSTFRRLLTLLPRREAKQERLPRDVQKQWEEGRFCLWLPLPNMAVVEPIRWCGWQMPRAL